MAIIRKVRGFTPKIGKDTFLADNAVVVGDVTIGDECTVAEIQRWNDERLHFEPVGEPVDMKQALTAETRAKCETLGRAMAARLLTN